MPSVIYSIKIRATKQNMRPRSELRAFPLDQTKQCRVGESLDYGIWRRAQTLLATRWHWHVLERFQGRRGTGFAFQRHGILSLWP